MTRLNGCHSKPRPAPGRMLIVQDGYREVRVSGQILRLPNFQEIRDVFDASVCAKGTQEPDAGCAGCPHAAELA